MSSAALKPERPPSAAADKRRSEWESQSRGEVWIRDWGGQWGFQAHLGRSGAVNLQPARPLSPRQLRCSILLEPAPPPAARQQSHSSCQRWPGEVRGITGGGQSQPIATSATRPARALPKPEASACGLKNGAARG